MRDPLHGITLKALVEELVERHGWEELGRRVPIRCFLYDPSLSSSLKFLRRTPWARAEVEALFLSEPPLERPETLALAWPADTGAPSAEVAPGFTLAVGGDEPAFRAVQHAIGFDVTDAIWSSLDLVPGAMVVAHGEGGPVAAACAQHRPGGWVELAWVAVAPAQRGRGLGRAVSAGVVRTLLEAGHTRIFGSTQDERVQALRIYLDLGFRPVQRPEKAERWAAALRR